MWAELSKVRGVKQGDVEGAWRTEGRRGRNGTRTQGAAGWRRRGADQELAVGIHRQPRGGEGGEGAAGELEEGRGGRAWCWQGRGRLEDGEGAADPGARQ